MKSLISFIDEGPEEKKRDKLRILIVSKSDDNHTVKRIVEDSKDQVDPNPSKTMSKLFSHVRKLMAQ